jgi:hypothetical protein
VFSVVVVQSSYLEYNRRYKLSYSVGDSYWKFIVEEELEVGL